MGTSFIFKYKISENNLNNLFLALNFVLCYIAICQPKKYEDYFCCAWIGFLHDRCCVQRCAFEKSSLISNFQRLSCCIIWIKLSLTTCVYYFDQKKVFCEMNSLKSLFVVVVGLLHDRCCVHQCAFRKEPLLPNLWRLSLRTCHFNFDPKNVSCEIIVCCGCWIVAW